MDKIEKLHKSDKIEKLGKKKERKKKKRDKIVNLDKLKIGWNGQNRTKWIKLKKSRNIVTQLDKSDKMVKTDKFKKNG